eukprot:jgi/Mesen1/2753/ME000017S02122
MGSPMASAIDDKEEQVIISDVSYNSTLQSPESSGVDEQLAEEIPSLCMRCHEQGVTRLLLVDIPHFRQIPELDFEIPPESQQGSLSTVEGVLKRAAEELRHLQDERRKADAVVADKIDAFVAKLDQCATGQMPLTFVLDDPLGNSFIENPHAPVADELLELEEYERSAEQNDATGFLPPPASTSTSSEPYVPAGTIRPELPHGTVGATGARRAMAIASASGSAADSLFSYSAPEEVMTFPATCSACAAPSQTRMFVTNIPYFKEVIVMATSCDVCGYKNSEVKPGGSISAKGKRITLKVKSVADFRRDVIKSDTASVIVPEVELELAAGTLGGRVTTVEGLLADISESLKRVQGFSMGDSAPTSQRQQWLAFEDQLQQLLRVEKEWTLILDDAVANSFIAPSAESIEKDTQLVVEEYERTWDQNEELGLNDMNTEGTPGGLTDGKFPLVDAVEAKVNASS